MARVGSPDPARPLGAVKRENIAAKRLVKKALVEPATHCVGLFAQHRRSNGIAEPLRDLRGGTPRRVHVCLDLGHGDRTLRQRSVGMENGVATILPTLVDPTLTRPPPLFDETLTVAVDVAVDPPQRRLNIRP